MLLHVLQIIWWWGINVRPTWTCSSWIWQVLKKPFQHECILGTFALYLEHVRFLPTNDRQSTWPCTALALAATAVRHHPISVYYLFIEVTCARSSRHSDSGPQETTILMVPCSLHQNGLRKHKTYYTNIHQETQGPYMGADRHSGAGWGWQAQETRCIWQKLCQQDGHWAFQMS